MKIHYVESFDPDINPYPDSEKIEIRAPKTPKVAKCISYKQKGQRKWMTSYVVKDELSNLVYTATTLKESVAYAKNLSIKKIAKYFVFITKTLIGDDPLVAAISPGKHRIGKYKFIILDKKPA